MLYSNFAPVHSSLVPLVNGGPTIHNQCMFKRHHRGHQQGIWKTARYIKSNALCVYPHCKVSIGQYTKMCTSPLIFFQLHYFRWQIFEENIWSLSLSLYIWPLESWTIIAIIRFNSILTIIGGRVECSIKQFDPNILDGSGNPLQIFVYFK